MAEAFNNSLERVGVQGIQGATRSVGATGAVARDAFEQGRQSVSEGFEAGAEVANVSGASLPEGEGVNLQDIPEGLEDRFEDFREQGRERIEKDTFLNRIRDRTLGDVSAEGAGGAIGSGIVDFHKGVAEGGARGWRDVIDSVTDERGTNIYNRDLEENIDATGSWVRDRLNPTVQADALDQGGRIGESVSSSASNTVSSVRDSVSDIDVSDSTSDVREASESVRESASKATESVRDNVEDASKNVQDSVNDVRDRASETVNNISDRIGF